MQNFSASTAATSGAASAASSSQRTRRKRSREQADTSSSSSQAADTVSVAGSSTTGNGTRTSKACAACRRVHACCEDTKPCKRCVRLGIQCEPATEPKKKYGKRKRQDETASAPATPVAPSPAPATQAPTSPDDVLNASGSSAARAEAASAAAAEAAAKQGSVPLEILKQMLGPGPRNASEDQQAKQQTAPAATAATAAAATTAPSATASASAAQPQPQASAARESLYDESVSSHIDPKDEELRKLRLELRAAAFKTRSLYEDMELLASQGQRFLGSGRVGIFVVGHMGQIIAMNEMLRRKLKYSIEDYTLHFLHVHDLFSVPQIFHSRVVRALKESPLSRESVRIHAPLKRSDGTIFNVFCDLHVTLDKGACNGMAASTASAAAAATVEPTILLVRAFVIFDDNSQDEPKNVE